MTNIMKRSIKGRSTITKIGFSFVSVFLLPSCHRPQVVNEPVLEFSYEKYEDGSAKEIGMRKNSLKEGLWISFYPNGRVHTIEFFEHDKRNGTMYSYYNNGRLSHYQETKDGLFHGEGYSYYSNGIMYGNVYFINDKQDGIFERYDDEGKLIDAVEYKNGEYVRTVCGVGPIHVPEEE